MKTSNHVLLQITVEFIFGWQEPIQNPPPYS